MLTAAVKAQVVAMAAIEATVLSMMMRVITIPCPAVAAAVAVASVAWPLTSVPVAVAAAAAAVVPVVLRIGQILDITMYTLRVAKEVLMLMATLQLQTV